jgi:hypothetical protein
VSRWYNANSDSTTTREAETERGSVRESGFVAAKAVGQVVASESVRFPTPRQSPSRGNKANQNPRGENPIGHTTRRRTKAAAEGRAWHRRSPRPWPKASSSTSPRGSAPSPARRRSVRTLRYAMRLRLPLDLQSISSAAPSTA